MSEKIAMSILATLNGEDVVVFAVGCPAWRIGRAGAMIIIHYLITKEETINMKRTAEEIKIRIHLLETRGEVMNAHLINKLKRQLRKMEAES